MKKSQYTIILALTLIGYNIQAQETEPNTDTSNYIEFNDSKNIVHGVYFGLNFNYGEIDGKSAYMAGAKIAYVANKKLEVGFTGVGFYSDQKANAIVEGPEIYGAYGGLHLEPIFFGDSEVSLSFPMLIGGGAASYAYDAFDSIGGIEYTDPDDWSPFFVFEPGASVLYNVSSYLQLELGVKYRLTSTLDMYPGSVQNLNGFSGGIGIKIGVFNLGKKRKY